MNESQRLADQLSKALDGGAWHGPSWKDVLEGVDRDRATARGVPGAHTIAEIVAHATTWNAVVRQRLLGESPQVSEEEDWPAAEPGGEEDWTARTTRFFETGRALAETVASFPAGKLLEERPGLDDTWYGLISGQLQHTLYHAGQIPILAKAAASKRR